MNSICLINDEDKSERTINSIEIEDNEKIKIFPLQKHLTEKIFIKGNKYSLYEPDMFDTDRGYDRDRYENYSDNDAFYDATDGQLGDLGHEGWTYLGRD